MPRVTALVRPSLIALAIAGLAVHAAHSATGFGGPGTVTFVDQRIYDGLIALAAAACLVTARHRVAERPAWLAIGLGLLVWGIGELVWTFAYSGDVAPPYPSVADAFYLAYYPLAYVGFVWLVVGNREERIGASEWLDGLVCALAVAAAGTAAIFEPILATTSGSTAVVATTLAYPLGDLVLLATVVGSVAVVGRGVGRRWMLIAAGITVLALADSISGYQASTGTYTEGTLFDSLWPLAALLIAGATLLEPRPRTPRRRLGGWRALWVPAFHGALLIGLLIYSRVHHFGDLAFALTMATLAALVARLVLTFRENVLALQHTQEESLTDALTGMGNRRQLDCDLREILAQGDRSLLMLFDLDGFKSYNDAFGHPAGDALLQRVARQLEASVPAGGRAYRMGGDELCVLAPRVDEATAVHRCSAALRVRGNGFNIGASHGVVRVPDEALSPEGALGLADQRMYASKDARKGNLGAQTRAVLMQVLSERTPNLHTHLTDVASLALAVGRQLGMSGEFLDEVARAAELHDVGKMAIPDAILNKPGPLDEVAFGYMREHTIIGERILAVAPALRPVARLVRSSHERWDGDGYPDGLQGEAIPLGARIVSVCDAFDAMTTDRAYRSAMPVDAAMAELRASAGTQFDSAVVDAFHATLRRQGWVDQAVGADRRDAASRI